MDAEPLLEVRNLSVHFPVRSGVLRRVTGAVTAVDDVSFELAPGETLALVGESGCGKTTLGRAVCNLLRPMHPDVRLAGRIVLRAGASPVDLNGLDHRRMRPHRRSIQMVFQDPAAALNPTMTVGAILERPLRIHGSGDRAERRRRIGELLERVGLPAESAARHPHEFSGGQQQRIGIARALATEPRLIVADEPVSALDVSVRAQILNLLAELSRDLDLALLFISHDLSVVRHVGDRIAVMYLGRLIELGTSDEVAGAPRHPYTRALWAAIPRPVVPRPGERRAPLAGDVPTMDERPSGCAFRTRCPIARAECADEVPGWRAVGGTQRVACPWTDPPAG